MEHKNDGRSADAGEATREIVFRIGDVFSPDDEMAVAMVALASAMNDLVRVNNWLDGGGLGSGGTPPERLHLFRLAVGHFHEARETLLEVRKLESAADLFGSLSRAGTADLETLTHLNTIGPDWFQKSIEYLRHKTFHYGGRWGWVDELWALREAADLESGLTWHGGTVRDVRFDFAELVWVQHLTRHLRESGQAADEATESDEGLYEKRLGEMMRSMAEATGAAIRVIQELVAAYVGPRQRSERAAHRR